MNFTLGFKDQLRFGTPGLRKVMLNLVSVGFVLITILHHLIHAPAVQNAGPPANVFLLLNMIWGIFVLRRLNRTRATWWLMTVPVWLAAMATDFAHH